MPVVKVSSWIALRVVHESAPTEVNSGNESVDIMVRLVKDIVPVMAFNVEPERLVRLTAPLQIRSPLICSMPSRKMAPATDDEIAIEPETVEQDDARAVASAWELIVAVA